MRRSTRQQSKPVIIDLVLGEGGFEIYDPNFASMIAAQKAMMMQKPDKPLNYSKTMGPKSVEKIGTPPSGNFGMPNDMLMRSKTTVKPPMMGPAKISMQNGMPTGERMPMSRPMGAGGDTIRREIQSFSNYSIPPAGMRQGHEGGSHEGYTPSQYGHPGGSTLSTLNSMVPSGYMKPPEKPQKVFPVVLPSCSQWFDTAQIHEIEKEGLPEFFIGKASKSPEIYKRYRNHIIFLYRQNIGNYLNATTCRKSLPGDACSIIRIHAFLERWGLINFHIDPQNNPKTLFLSRPNFTHERLAEASQSDPKMEIFDKINKSDLTETEQKELINQIKKLENNARPVCDFCGIRCGLGWYYQKGAEPAQPKIELEGDAAVQAKQDNQENEVEKKIDYKGKRMILCTKCYSEQNFPKLLTSVDFFKVDPTNIAGSTRIGAQLIEAWTHEDTYRLLDLIQKFGDNWNEIQKNLSHKTKAEIIAHYLQLPLNNITSINILDMGELKGHEETTNERVADLTPTVFGDFSNPILQHVAVYKSLLNKSREQTRKKKEEQDRIAKQIADEQDRLAKQAAEEQKQRENAAKIEEERSEEKEIVKIQEGEEMNIEKPENENEIETEEVEKAGEAEDNAMKIEEGKPEGEAEGEGEAEEKPAEMIEEKKEEEEETNEVQQESEVKKEEEVVKPEVPKTKEEVTFGYVEQMVRNQVSKLDNKIEFLGEFEDMLVRERTQFDVLQQALLLDQIEFAKKKLEAVKSVPIAAPQQFGQNGPASTQNASYVPQAASTFENREPGFFDFNANSGGNTFGGGEIADFVDGSFL